MGIRKYTTITFPLGVKDFHIVSSDKEKRNSTVILPIIYIVEEIMSEFYLYRYDFAKNFLGDTYHDDLEDVLDQMIYEVGEQKFKWQHVEQNSKDVIQSVFNYIELPLGFYRLKYMHDYATTSLWSYNEESNMKYGYAIDINNLPLSSE